MISDQFTNIEKSLDLAMKCRNPSEARGFIEIAKQQLANLRQQLETKKALSPRKT